MINLFSSFIWGGYECNSALAKDKRFNDLQDTRHHINCLNDYQLVKSIDITTVREGLLWSQIDKGYGNYDFTLFESIMQLGKNSGIEQIWDLNHFDYPSYLDPFSSEFIDAFTKYAVESIKVIRKYNKETIYVVPFNEISFFSFMGGSVGAWAPFGIDVGVELKMQCVKAVVSAINAIRKIDKYIRFIHVDPLMMRKPRKPNVITLSYENTFERISFESLDMLAGKVHPELGGSMDILDIIGINHYPSSQEWLNYSDDYKVISHERMDWLDPNWTPFAKMLLKVASRYNNQPIVVSETGAWGRLREDWWKTTLEQVDIALNLGINLQGVCAYPIIDRRDWSQGHLTNSGFWDFAEGDVNCSRIPYKSVIRLIKNYIKDKTNDSNMESMAKAKKQNRSILMN